MNERNKRSFTKMQNLSIYFVIVKRFPRQTLRFNVERGRTTSYDVASTLRRCRACNLFTLTEKLGTHFFSMFPFVI